MDFRFFWQRCLPPVRLFQIAAGIFFLLARDPCRPASVQPLIAEPTEATPTTERALYGAEISAWMSDPAAIFKFFSALMLAGRVALPHVTCEQPAGTRLVFAPHNAAIDFSQFLLLATVDQQPLAIGIVMRIAIGIFFQ